MPQMITKFNDQERSSMLCGCGFWCELTSCMLYRTFPLAFLCVISFSVRTTRDALAVARRLVDLERQLNLLLVVESTYLLLLVNRDTSWTDVD